MFVGMRIVSARVVESARPKPTVKSSESRLYRQLVPAYELVFPMIFAKRIQRTIRGMALPHGARILEVGVGTGISLCAYPRHCSVTGIDLNEEMLQRANKKIEKEGWQNIELMKMNAERLEFPDASFDVVCAFHVLSVVSRPVTVMNEIVRVCRPGGHVVLINHFRSPNPWIAKVVDRADSVTRVLGWRTDLACDDVVRRLPLRVERRYKSSPLSLFTIVKAQRTEDAANDEVVSN